VALGMGLLLQTELGVMEIWLGNTLLFTREMHVSPTLSGVEFARLAHHCAGVAQGQAHLG